uniref:Uncharacterized protein n=1 Tax=Mucochytrium quahogii TaxID=96639 RepID=A0A7S2WR48_9STRA
MYQWRCKLIQKHNQPAQDSNPSNRLIIPLPTCNILLHLISSMARNPKRGRDPFLQPIVDHHCASTSLKPHQPNCTSNKVADTHIKRTEVLAYRHNSTTRSQQHHNSQDTQQTQQRQQQQQATT